MDMRETAGATAMTADTKAERREIIRLDNVHYRYPGAEHEALAGINLVLHAGEFTAVAGGNGSGKSTLCKCFNGLIPHYYAGDFSGEVFVAGEPASRQSVAALSRRVGYVFQDFENQLVRPTVLDEASFAPLNYGFADYRERGERALERVGLDRLKHEWIWQLSGGQKHLAALAGVLALDPDVIVVDEPAAQLDPAHARMVYECLKRLNEEEGKTIVVIEHHTEFIADYCSHMVLMGPGGRLLWKKPVEEGLNELEQLAALGIQPPQVTQAFSRPGWNRADGRRLPIRVDEAARLWRESAGMSGEDGLRGADGIAGENETAATETAHLQAAHEAESQVAERRPIVVADGLCGGYQDLDRRMKPVLRDLTVRLYEGERVALVGGNGSGKSTFLRHIAGIRKPYAGELTVCGLDVRRETPERLADKVAFIFQNPEEMFIEDRVRRDIEYFPRERGVPHSDELVETIVGRFNLEHLQHRDGRLLSGGQQRRATLGIGLAMRPEVLLLDEPTASLDLTSREELRLLLDQLRHDVRLVIVATHDMQLVAEWATRVLVMHGGGLLLDAEPRELFARRDLMEKAALLPPQITRFAAELGFPEACLTVDEFVRMGRRGRP